MRRIAAAILCAALSGCVTPAGGVDVSAARPLAPGEVGTACGLGRGDRGAEVASAPEAGRARWRIYDTAPGSTAPRTQYVTGFSDGCARQVTAALMLFGSPAVRETLRYDAANTNPYSAIDTAYERLKSRACGAPARVPCPVDRLAALERRVTFVTVYPTFGATSGLVEILIDGGRVVAIGSD